MSTSNILVNNKNRRKKREVFPIEVKGVFPKRRQEVLNLNGWGFLDSYFTTEKGQLTFVGNR